MREYRQIVQMWKQGKVLALATLVRTQGSSYRRPGARLLIDEDTSTGTISGGCLEAEVVRKASWLVRQGAIVERYSTEFDESGDIPFGLGCGGIVDLLLEPANTPEFKALMEAVENAIAGNESIVLTWLPRDGHGLKRAVLSADGEYVFTSESLSQSDLTQVKGIVRYSLEPLPYGIFMEQLSAPQRLYVFGAGDDAKPLVSMGSLLGWDIRVMDGRSQLARRERFPEAESVSVTPSPVSNLAGINKRDAVVIMTHAYEQDRELLATVLPMQPSYIGLLGARHRTSFLISEVAAILGCSIAECCEHIHAPIGLDLGGDGPEAIALAVIAEVQGARTGKLVHTRKLSAQDIASYTRNGNSAHGLEARCAQSSR